MSLDTFNTHEKLSIAQKQYCYFSLKKLEDQGFDVFGLPYCLKILLENVLRNENGESITKQDITNILAWDEKANPDKEISFVPARVLMQDFTGVPAIVDLAAMRDAITEMGGDYKKINPLLPTELVIDHSIQVDSFASPDSLRMNISKEFQRNKERYAFLRWGQTVFDNFRVVPPGTGIVHQVNIEYLSRIVFLDEVNTGDLLYPDTLIGTDSHTTMANGLGVLGWGVGGIEAEAAMLGQAIPMLVPQVVGVRFVGRLQEGVTATDLVLTVTNVLRKKGVVGKFVEFFGAGVSDLSLEYRSTLSNMSPEYGSTCAIFPIDDMTLKYLALTGRSSEQVAIVEAYAKKQGLFGAGSENTRYTDIVELDLSSVEPCIAGPKRPQDLIRISDKSQKVICADKNTQKLGNGSIVIAAITSCTNTSNPSVLMGAGLLAKKALAMGLQRKPWVKTSFSPGSKVVTEYLNTSGLIEFLDALGFNNTGYGCMTCIGNSGPLPEDVVKEIDEKKLHVCSVLSGNRNFEGRINPHVQANFLASPLLVVAYAIAGNINIDFSKDPLGKDNNGKDIFLKDIWPSDKNIAEMCEQFVKSEIFKEKYADVFAGNEEWKNIDVSEAGRYRWHNASTYVRRPTFLTNVAAKSEELKDIKNARVLAILGDSVTTDHISPAGAIKGDSPAGKYLEDCGVNPKDFNSYGSRRGNHEVMMRGTFANIRLRNQLVPGAEGGWTKYFPANKEMTIFDAAVKYKESDTPLVVFAGKEYGSGSSRDWAAKGTHMLGINIVIAESFERIHRSNLIGMGIMPAQFEEGQSLASLGLTGEEIYDITGIKNDMIPGEKLTVVAALPGNKTKEFQVLCRIDTPMELEYYKNGGILPYVLRQIDCKSERL